MVSVKDVFAYINGFAPVSTKMDFDNVGILVGREDSYVKRAVIALDITDEVIKEAAELQAELIISHHPLFFSLKNVCYSDFTGRKIINLIENHIAAICMHTNLDASMEGVSRCLAEAIGLTETTLLETDGTDEFGKSYGLGYIGMLPESISLQQFIGNVKLSLGANGIRYVASGKPVNKVAVLGGSGSSEIDEVIKQGCDTYVTADIKYDVFLKAKETGLNLVDAGHFPTENVITAFLDSALSEKFPDVDFVRSKLSGQPELFF